MNKLVGKKFIASYSGGKDSVLAIHRAAASGLIPHSLITTHNPDLEKSWFHGLSEGLLMRISASLELPVDLARTTGEHYEASFEAALIKGKAQGAEVCVFGDIDIEDHLNWCRARCDSAEMIPYFPLLKEDRKKVVFEFVDAGYLALIKIVDTSRMSGDFVGKILSREVIAEIEKTGVDICGENGEYHTFVFDGPLFKNKLDFEVKEKLVRDKFAILNIF